MSGILDKKIKLIDLLITQEGRRQMSMGGLRPTFASFSDKEVDYQSLSGSTKQSTDKLYFQTPSAMTDDQIVFETDDRGRLLVRENYEQFRIVNDDVYLLTASNGNPAAREYLSVTGSQFSSTMQLIKDKTLNAFANNRFVRTVSGFDVDGKNFRISKDNHTFVISNSVPFASGPEDHVIDIDHTETFMFDSKLAHNVNFQFLPPVNSDGSKLGNYQDLRSLRRQTFEDIKLDLGVRIIPEFDSFQEENTVFNYDGDLLVKNRAPNLPFDSTLLSREAAQIYFPETSEFNNFIGQFYEENLEEGTVRKLDIIDAGEFYDEIDLEKPAKHVYYVGKILFDTNNIPSFVNIFTIILD